MFPITQMPAFSLAFPDVCQTPTPAGPVPIPYPNMETSGTAVPTNWNILILAMPAHSLATVTPLTNGDEAGVAMGVASGQFIGQARHMLGSFKVFFNCMPATKMLNPTGQNGMMPNMAGTTLSPSQVTVMIMS